MEGYLIQLKAFHRKSRKCVNIKNLNSCCLDMDNTGKGADM